MKTITLVVLCCSLSFAQTKTQTHNVTLTCQPAENAIAYNFYRGTTPDGPYVRINPEPLPKCEYVDKLIEVFKTYYYVATAINTKHQESGYSNQAVAVMNTKDK